MIPIRAIDHVVLRCRDLDRMLAFYRDVLDLPLERVQPGLYQLRAGAALVDLIPADGPDGRNLDHVCFKVSPFDAREIARHLAERGVAAGEVVTRYGADGEGPSMYVEDPEGNRVELKGP